MTNYLFRNMTFDQKVRVQNPNHSFPWHFKSVKLSKSDFLKFLLYHTALVFSKEILLFFRKNDNRSID